MEDRRKNHDRRKNPRRTDIEVKIQQCVVTRLGRETWLDAKSNDLSEGGLSLYLEDPLDPGERIYVLAEVNCGTGECRELSLNGVTSNVAQAENGKWRVGMRFIDMSEEEVSSWKEFLT